MEEALELSSSIITVPVKDKLKNWEPSKEETYPLIYSGVMKALEMANQAKTVDLEPPYMFSMELCEGFVFDTDCEISWKGSFYGSKADWTAPSLEIGLELFNYVRAALKKAD